MAGFDALFTHNAAVGHLLDQRPVVDGGGIDIIRLERLTYDILGVADILQVAFAAGVARDDGACRRVRRAAFPASGPTGQPSAYLTFASAICRSVSRAPNCRATFVDSTTN